MLKLPLPPKILIVRLSAIGDCVQTMPVAKALKSNFPKSNITWVVDCAAQQLLEGHASVDEVIRFKKGFLGRPKEAWNCIRLLRSKRFDLAIDPQGLLKSAVLGWASGAKIRIGFDASQAREKAWWFYTKSVQARPGHLIEKQLQLLEPLGIVVEKPDFGFSTKQEDDRFVDQLLSNQSWQRGRFALLNVGAGWPSRRWPTERFVQVAKALRTRFSLPSLVVWAGEQELETAKVICNAAPDDCQLAPATSLMQLAAIIRASRIMITSDTGPMHIASALNVPTVALFGPTRPEHSGPYAQLSKAIQKGDLNESREDKKSGQNRLLQRIDASDVIEVCGQLLQQIAND